MFDYKTVIIPAKEFQIGAEGIIRSHAEKGWRLVQILPPPSSIPKSFISLFGLPLLAITSSSPPAETSFTLILERSA